MAGEVPPVSAGHSRKSIYVLLAWALLLHCAFTGLQWQPLFPRKQQYILELQQPAGRHGHAGPASPTDAYFQPMAGE